MIQFEINVSWCKYARLGVSYRFIWKYLSFRFLSDFVTHHKNSFGRSVSHNNYLIALVQNGWFIGFLVVVSRKDNPTINQEFFESSSCEVNQKLWTIFMCIFNSWIDKTLERIWNNIIGIFIVRISPELTLFVFNYAAIIKIFLPWKVKVNFYNSFSGSGWKGLLWR